MKQVVFRFFMTITVAIMPPMPLPVAHALVGAGVVAAMQQERTSRRAYAQMLIAALLANAADLDFLLVYAQGSKTWHRAFTHSFGFSLLVFVLLALWLGRRKLKTAVAYGIAFGSHAVLDFVTTREGSAIELFWPFSDKRVMLGWWGLSEWPSRMTASQIVLALALEFALFAPVLLTIMFLRRRSVSTS
jgi:membrane-bound metal-dependent hydrolase YbcI (DUF457 family)